MSTKIIGLDSLKHIKSYIDKVRGSIREEIDADTKAYLEEGIKEASEAIYNDYESKYKELIDAIAKAEANGGKGLEELKLQLDALVNNTNDKFVALDSLETDLKKLNGEYDDLNIKYNSIFSPGQLDEVIRTALITETVITDEMVSTPNVFATKIVSLIANMGHINAGSIDAGTMRGSSIESTNTIVTAPNPNKVEAGEPVWKIDNAGNGWFARGNIHWDTDGNVTFGPGVKLKWESISNADKIMQDIFEGYDKEVRDYVKDFIKESTEAAASKKELENLKKDADKAVEDLKLSLSQEIAINKESAEDAINKVNTWIENDYEDQQENLKNYYDGVTAALDQAIKDGDAELIEKLKKLQEEIDYKMEKTYADYIDVMHAVGLVSKDMEKLKDSALTKHDAADLLEASLITESKWENDHVATPTLLAKKIVGLVGTFGLIKASKIEGTTIQGYTISSPDAVKDDDGNVVYTETYEYLTDENGDPVISYELNEDGSYKLDNDGNKIPIKDENDNYIYVLATELDENGEPQPKKVPARLTEDQIAWALKSDGAGWLAEHLIEWDYFINPDEVDWNNRENRDQDGKIIYPDNIVTDSAKRHWRKEHCVVNVDPRVKFTWDQINDKPDGLFKFKSTAFIRTNTDISNSKPSGGNYDNPKPTNKVGEKEWEDGIPSGEEQLWATTATVAWGEETIDWDLPKKMTDTVDFEVLYNINPITSKPQSPQIVYDEHGIKFSKDVNGNIDSEWLNKAKLYGWYDEIEDMSDGQVPNWMATCKAKNGNWLPWEVSQIKGEKGDTGGTGAKGEDGDGVTSTTITYQASSSGTNIPGADGWKNSIAETGIVNGQYLWTKIEMTFRLSETKTSYSVSRFANDGGPGAPGSNGRGVIDTEVTFLVTNTISPIPSDNAGWDPNMPNSVDPGKFLWTRVQYNWSDGDKTYSHSVARMGENGAFDAENLATALEDFKISSNTIAANIFTSTKTKTLPSGTKFYEVDEDGTFNGDTEIIEGKTYPKATSADGNVAGPRWQIAWNGNGYFADGKIRFDEDGLTVDGKVIMNGISNEITTNPNSTESTAFKKLIADNAQIGDLEVGVLNTGLGKENENGRIKIEDNTISVYQEGATNEIMLVTGNTASINPFYITSTLESTNTIGASTNIHVSTDSIGTGSISISENASIERIKTLGSINITKGPSILSLNTTFKIFSDIKLLDGATGNVSNFGGKAYACFFISTETYSILNDSLKTAIKNIPSASISISNLGANIPSNLYYYNGSNMINITDASSLSTGNYNVYIAFVASDTLGGQLTGSSITNGLVEMSVGLEIKAGDVTIEFNEILNKTIISGNGIHYVKDGKNQMKFTKDNGFYVQCGQYGLRCTDNGLQKTTNGGTDWDDI